MYNSMLMLMFISFMCGIIFCLMLIDLFKTLQKESDEEKQKQAERETFRKGEK